MNRWKHCMINHLVKKEVKYHPNQYLHPIKHPNIPAKHKSDDENPLKKKSSGTLQIETRNFINNKAVTIKVRLL